MSVDSAGMAARLGIKPGMVVQELGWDEDADEDLRDAIIEVSGGEMVDEDTDEVADVVILWWREDDGDLFDALGTSSPVTSPRSPRRRVSPRPAASPRPRTGPASAW
jgi:hypothetical protein